MTEPITALPSRAALRNYTAAHQAIRHVRAKLPRRSPDRRLQPKLDVDRERFPLWILGHQEQIWQLTGEAEALQQARASWPTETLAHRLAREAERSGLGTAAEQAIVVFAHLLHLGIRPLDYMHATGREHAFVVVGRTTPVADGERGHLEDDADEGVLTAPKEPVVELIPESWGVDAVVCDPWRGVALRQQELINTEYYYDYYPCESQLHVPLTAADTFD